MAKDLLIGSHVGFSSGKQLLGSVEEALSYGSNTFMFYTGAPQNTKRNPIKKDLFIRLGYAQLTTRQNEEAKKTFERALKVFKMDSEVITGYGMALYRLERFEEARQEFIKAFSLDAHNLNALFLTATIDVMFKDYER